MNFEDKYSDLLLINKLYINKKKKCKKKSAQTGKGVNVIAYNNYLNKNLMCTRI